MSEKIDRSPLIVPLTPKASKNVYIRRKCLQLSLEILEGKKKP